MDWNSDGEWDIISGDRTGYLNVFIRHDTTLAGYKQYRLLDSTFLNVGLSSAPSVFDWNDDGRKDLVIGCESYEIRVYLNVASDTWPMFQDYFVVSAGGSPVSFFRANPYFFDLDQDGRLDLVCGENWGYVHFFRNLGPDTNPEFAPAETLRLASGEPVRWRRSMNYYGSRCGFGDWNNDGIPDFLMGSYVGQVELYLGMPPTGVEERGRRDLRGVFSVSPSCGTPPVMFKLNVDFDSRLLLCDQSGRTVRDFGRLAAGHRALSWDGRDVEGRRVPAGVYFFCRLAAGGHASSRRLVIFR